ncbi:MAG: hypothetical protein AAGF88_01605 [Pseudomonadota bacterium]
MFTWIFRLSPVVLLASCVGLGLGGGNARVSVTQDALVVEAPRGFCVDQEARRDDGLSAFLVFGNCAGMSGSRFAAQPPVEAVLTATISEPGDAGGISAALADLPAYFGSPDGRAVLSRTGDPETVTLLQSFVAGDILYLRAQDESPGVVPGVEDIYWRAYFDLGPRIATLSVLAMDDARDDEAAQLSTLESFVAGTRAANPNVLPSAPDTAPSTQAGLFNSGFFRGILGPRQAASSTQ